LAMCSRPEGSGADKEWLGTRAPVHR
jgi:hypothetical protein